MPSFSPVVPGLFVATVVFLMIWVLRRWFDQLPWWWGGVVMVVLTVLFGSALFLGEVVFPVDPLAVHPPFEKAAASSELGNRIASDLVNEQNPWRLRTAEFYRGGEWPLWNRRQGFGMPFMADPQTQVFEFPALVATVASLGVISSSSIMTCVSSLRLALPLIFFFVLLRRLGCGTIASAYGSLSYGIGGFLLVWLGWPAASPAALLPACLYALLLVVERGSRSDVVLLVTVGLALIFSGHPEGQLHVGLLGALLGIGFVLFRLEGTRARLGAMARIAGIMILTISLAAPLLLPLLEWLPQTHRAEMLERRNQRWAQRAPLEPLSSSLEAGDGTFLGAMIVRSIPVLAPRALGEERSVEYLGDPTADRPGAGFVGTITLVLALLALMGWADRTLPREFRWLVLLSLLGAAGTFVVILAIPPLPWMMTRVPVLDHSATFHARISACFGFCLSLLGALSLEGWLRRGASLRNLISGTAVTTGVLVYCFWFANTNHAVSSYGFLWVHLSFVAIFTSAVVLARWTVATDRIRTLIGSLFVLLVVVELVFWFGAANPSTAEGMFYPKSDILRTLTSEAGDQDRIVGLGEILPANIASVYGLSDVRVSSPAKPWIVVEKFRDRFRSIRDMRDRFPTITPDDASRFGVVWILVPTSQAGSIQEERSGWVWQASAEGVVLFKNPEAHDRLWIEGPSSLRLLAEEDSRISAAVAPTSGEGSLALRSNLFQDGNWHLLLDGHPVDAGSRVGDPLLAANLPASRSRGGQQLELLYRPGSFVLGSLVAGVALALLIVVTSRRPHSTSSS